VAARAGAGRCRGLPPGGRPPCAAGAKAEWPHHATVFCGRVAPARQATRASWVALLACALARRGRAIGARRAPRAFKDVKIIVTGSDNTCCRARDRRRSRWPDGQ